MDYKIDGNIDFYKELQNVEAEDTIPNTPTCLISREPLYGRYVSLECGHSFNYLPLFKDIYNHKKKFNFKEGRDNQLKLHQIRCPYCRHIQNSVMPYYAEFNVKQHGINIILPPSKTGTPGSGIHRIIDVAVSDNTHPKKVNTTQQQICIAILKYGNNKGSQCKNKVLCNFYCGRHSNHLNK